MSYPFDPLSPGSLGSVTHWGSNLLFTTFSVSGCVYFIKLSKPFLLLPLFVQKIRSKKGKPPPPPPRFAHSLFTIRDRVNFWCPSSSVACLLLLWIYSFWVFFLDWHRQSWRRGRKQILRSVFLTKNMKFMKLGSKPDAFQTDGDKIRWDIFPF